MIGNSHKAKFQKFWVKKTAMERRPWRKVNLLLHAVRKIIALVGCATQLGPPWSALSPLHEAQIVGRQSIADKPVAQPQPRYKTFW